MKRQEPYDTFLIQHGLKARGYPLKKFGVDGVWGSETQAAYEACVKHLSKENKVLSKWPSDDIEELINFYGRPDLVSGYAPKQVELKLPYPMKLSWMPSVQITKSRCHKAVHDSLSIILQNILKEFGKSGIEEYGLNILGGITNVRTMRGDDIKISRHSFGIAIDLNPTANGMRTPWPKKATMPEAVIEIFEEQGWTSFARVRGIDAMHFQATSNYIGN